MDLGFRGFRVLKRMGFLPRLGAPCGFRRTRSIEPYDIVFPKETMIVCGAHRPLAP